MLKQVILAHFESKINETPRPLYHWSLGAAGGQPSRRTVGANGGATGVPGAKNNNFFPSCSYTTWDAQTSVFRPFGARGGAFWAMENPKMP